MRISVIGTGYVGLVSGVCFAEKGHEVVCVDNDQFKVDQIKKSISPIYEKGLDELLSLNIGGRLSASTDLYKAVHESDISILAVGTPYDGDEIDLKYVREVSKQIGLALKEKDSYHTVIVKSTVLPGTTDNQVLPLLEKFSNKKSGANFGVGMNPEFLREGEAISDFMYPDRIVLGAIDKRTHDVMIELYDAFSDVDILLTNNKTAEMIKYTSNSLLATLISFSNEIGNLSASLGDIDAIDVMNGVHLDKRISPILEDNKRLFPSLISYLEPGCGYGGSCFPKDVKALIAHGKNNNQPMPLLKAVVNINDVQPYEMIDRLRKHYKNINKLKIAVLGLAFKPGTDDMRESPSIKIINNLLEENAIINAYDPVAQDEAKKIFNNSNIHYCESVIETIYDADIIMLLTRWPEFKDVPKILKDNNLNPLVIDGRRMIQKDSVSRYEGIGL